MKYNIISMDIQILSLLPPKKLYPLENQRRLSMSTQVTPDTADGWTVLHQMFSVDWSSLQTLTRDQVQELAGQFQEILSPWLEKSDHGQSALFHVLGHKADLMLLHFRSSFDLCGEIELAVSRSGLGRFLTPTTSYLSVVELGMYRATVQLHEELSAEGLEPDSKEWKEQYQHKLDKFKESFYPRCYTEIPEHRYMCFYPMSKKRLGQDNWYTLPVEKRAELMLEHGMTGRHYTDRVKQIISGSIGYDDWEWGVDLFAHDHLDLKRLVYKMRFDEGSSRYGEFGPFYLGLRLAPDGLVDFLRGAGN